jgi:hypothetical protein
MANGASVTGLNPDYYLSLKGNQNLQVGNFILYVDASIARDIYLPSILTSEAKFGVAQNHLFIYVFGTSAVYVYPSSGEQINGGQVDAPILIQNTSDSGFTVTDIMPIVNVLNGGWFTPYVANNGSGGGGTVQMLSFDVTIPALRVNELLNDETQSEIIIPAPLEINRLYEIHTCNFLLSGGGTGRDGVNPALGVFGLSNSNNAWISYTGDDALATNTRNVAWSIYNGIATNYSVARFPSNGTAFLGGIAIGNFKGSTYNVTQGDSDLRVFGTYSIMQL